MHDANPAGIARKILLLWKNRRVTKSREGRPGIPRSGRDRFHPVTLQSLWGSNHQTGTLAMRDASAFAAAPCLTIVRPQGLIRDGVETIPTMIR